MAWPFFPPLPSMSLKILIYGAGGRMADAVVQASRPGEFEITAQVGPNDRAESVVDGCDVAIDFSVHSATLPLAKLAAARGKALVIGTTGHTAEEKAAIARHAGTVPTVWAGNFSVGVNLLFHLTQQAASVLAEEFDMEVVEMHHRHKKDAPSGTAARLLEVLREARGLGEEQIRHGRAGLTGERPGGEIGMHSLRGGDVVGDHTVVFAGPGERLELSHKASSRRIFAEGALRAASWVVRQGPGIYDMQDVLGLRPARS